MCKFIDHVTCTPTEPANDATRNVPSTISTASNAAYVPTYVHMYANESLASMLFPASLIIVHDVVEVGSSGGSASVYIHTRTLKEWLPTLEYVYFLHNTECWPCFISRHLPTY